MEAINNFIFNYGVLLGIVQANILLGIIIYQMVTSK